jgi:hypothetical protein
LPRPAPEEVSEPQRAVEEILTADDRRTEIDEGFRAVEKRHVDRVRERARDFDIKARPALRRVLSRVSDELVRPETFVQRGESVEEKNRGAIRRGIVNTVNSADPLVRPLVRGFVAMTDAQAESLRARLNEDGVVDAEGVDEVLGSKISGPRPGATLIAEDPLLEICRRPTEVRECAELALQGPSVRAPAPSRRDEAGSTVEPLTGDDVPRFVAQLIGTMTSPEEALLTGLEPRADRARVEQDLKDLSLRPSPADTPAFYDFQQLQIAFEDVWQEVIDEGILDIAEDAYQDIVELGGDPDERGGDDDPNPLRAIRNEGRRVLTTRRTVRDHRGRTRVRLGARSPWRARVRLGARSPG